MEVHPIPVVCGTGNNKGRGHNLVGGAITNSKCREWVIFKGGESIEDAYKTIVAMGTHAATAAFADGIFTVLCKRYATSCNVPAGYQMMAPTTGKRASKEATAQTIKAFLTDSQRLKTSLIVKHIEAKSGIYTPEEVMAHCKRFTSKDWTLLVAQASRAQSGEVSYREQPDLAPLHKAVNKFGAQVGKAILERDRAGADMIYRIDDPEILKICPFYVEDIPDSTMQQRVRSWDRSAKKPDHFTFKDYMYTDKHKTHSMLPTG